MADKGDKTGKGGSGASTALAFALLTALSGGVGGALGYQMAAKPEPADGPAKIAEAEGGAALEGSPEDPERSDHAETEYASGPTTLIPLEPVLTTLRHPPETWVRLEAALLVDASAEEQPELAARMARDINAYLQTTDMSALEGATGLRYLTEDLNDIAAVQTDGAVREVVIQTLVVQ